MSSDADSLNKIATDKDHGMAWKPRLRLDSTEMGGEEVKIARKSRLRETE